MIERPAFKPYFRVETVPDEGTFLLSEHGHFVLTGKLNDLVVPLIDGERSADQIADELAGQARMEEVFYALAALEHEGHLVEADSAMPESESAFWTSLGLDTRIAGDRLRRCRVELTDLVGFAAEAGRRALGRAGLRIEDGGDVRLVIADDYERPELSTINDEHLESRRPWMLLRPYGNVLWLGPMFVPGETGCHECLASRLRGNREVETFIRKKLGRGPFPLGKSKLAASLDAAFDIAALQLSILVASDYRLGVLKGAVVTYNAALLQNDVHVLVRRPQCPACGDPASTRKYHPVTFGDGAATGSLQDGGARAATPEETFERYRHHVSPVSGVVSSLMPAPNMQSGPLRVWVAGHNFALKNDSLYFLQDGLRSNSAGKGMTDAQARTSALCEAIERYSGLYRGEEPAIRATFRELGERAIHPNDCMLFSDRQFQERDAWNARRSRFQVVPMTFRDDARLEWSEVQSLTTGETRYLPTGYLYYGYPLKDEEFFYWADSNGNAAGNSIEEAALQGFLELVERDAVCIWWYNRLNRPAVDLASLEEPYLKHLDAFYRRHNRVFWVLDLTTDTGIPTFASISRRVDRPVEDIVMGFGAHLDARVAIMRAITEMNQFMPAVLRDNPGGGTDYAYQDPDALLWWQTATVANQPYLAPAMHPPVPLSAMPALATNNLREDLRTCVRIAQGLGIEVLLLDQTRPDVGLNVVKVMTPGLRHFWARFAPGRLYDVPPRMGWLQQSLPEAFLNPIPMFI